MGISHRDIKPENIIFDSNWNTKIVDFGFSCTINSIEDKMRTTVCGTPSYTPP
jgi:serine/threonine protein kinase